MVHLSCGGLLFNQITAVGIFSLVLKVGQVDFISGIGNNDEGAGRVVRGGSGFFLRRGKGRFDAGG